MPVIYYILSEQPNALQLTGDNGNGFPLPPPSGQIISLTAVVLNDDGKTLAPTGTPVYWYFTDVNSGTFVFYINDKKNGWIGCWDSYTGTTDENGQSQVYLGSAKKVIAQVKASTSAPRGDGKDIGSTMNQSVAIFTFDAQGTLIALEGFEIDAQGCVEVDPPDGSENPPSPQNGVARADATPGTWFNNGDYWMLWTATGDPSDLETNPQRGTAIGGIREYSGQFLARDVPYDGFDNTKRNNLVYFIFSNGVSSYSKNWNFCIDNTPMQRPDEGPPPNFDVTLSSPCWVSRINPSDYSSASLQCPVPTLLTPNDFQADGNLYFAIKPYAPFTLADTIEITFYLNGWMQSDPFQLHALAWSPDPYLGSDFTFETDGKTPKYLVTYISRSECLGFTTYGGYEGRYGYMWIEYTVNGTRVAPWAYTRINFPDHFFRNKLPEKL